MRGLAATPDKIEAVPQNLGGWFQKSFLGFLANISINIMKKNLFNYCLHFEAISIYVCPILKWLPCKLHRGL